MESAPGTDYREWLESIEDEQERDAVEALLELTAGVEYEEEDADVYTPFVYPH